MNTIEGLIEYIETFQNKDDWSNEIWLIKVAAIQLKESQGQTLPIDIVSKCLPTETEYLEIRNELAKEHIDRLSKQPLYFILRAGIEKGMDSIINRIKANDC